MNNRTWWGLGVVALAVLVWFGVMARRNNSRPTESVNSPPATDVALPGVSQADPVVSHEAGPGTRPGGQDRAQTRPKLGGNQDAGTSVPLSRPSTQGAAAKPRLATYADAVRAAGNPEELTPQKVARVALSYVGADPVAEQVWEAAINSPNFTANARKDLIEDLNQEGFDDPKNPTQADLPLIVRRLQLIQALAPQSADEVNAAAFAEAYKDLTNMYTKLTK